MINTSSNNFISKLNSPDIQKLAVSVFSVGVVLGTGIGHGFTKTITSRSAQTYVTRVEYERIQPGMALTNVLAILGSGTEISRSESEVKFAG